MGGGGFSAAATEPFTGGALFEDAAELDSERVEGAFHGLLATSSASRSAAASLTSSTVGSRPLFST